MLIFTIFLSLIYLLIKQNEELIFFFRQMKHSHQYTQILIHRTHRIKQMTALMSAFDDAKR